MSTVELLKLLYVFSFNLGLWANISTLLNKRCAPDTKRLLFVFISILLVMPLNGYLSLSLDTPLSLLSALANTLTWSYGPLAYLLVNNLLKKTNKPFQLALHFTPFITVTGIYLFQFEWLSFYYYQSTLLMQLTAYLSLTLVNLYIYRKKIVLVKREFRNSSYYWMLYLVGGLFAIVIYENTLVFMLHQGAEIAYAFVATTVGLFSVYISTIAIFLLFQPSILGSHESSSNQESKAPISTGNKQSPDTENEHSRNIELPEAAAKTLGEELHVLMTKDKLYLENDICLSKLAEKLGITNHNLSELLNFHLQTNFYDYLNQFRFEEAKALMLSHTKQYSVMDIAYLAGFNNRNTFYRVFKQNTGLTPGEFRKQASQKRNQHLVTLEKKS